MIRVQASLMYKGGVRVYPARRVRRTKEEIKRVLEALELFLTSNVGGAFVVDTDEVTK